jgi:hypothetical protein
MNPLFVGGFDDGGNRSTAVASFGYERPAPGAETEPGMLGRTLVVANVTGSRTRASL